MLATWDKDISRAIIKHFKTYADSIGIPLVFEEAVKDNATVETWIELRVDGPKYRAATKDKWLADIVVNALISSANNNDIYKLSTVAGQLSTKFVESIPVLNDAGAQITCLSIIGKDVLRISNLGHVNDTTKIRRKIIEGTFEGFLEG